MKWLKFWIVGLLVFWSSCSYPDQEFTVFSISYFFNTTDQEWTGDFADYPESDSVAYGLYLHHDLLPDNLNTTGDTHGLHIAGTSSNRDLFMFIKKKISGLRPNTTYELLFNIKIASDTPSGVGASVYLKAGASIVEPRKELQSGIYRMNIDKGNQDASGVDMITIGNVGTSVTPTQFTIITRTNNSDSSFTATTDGAGEIWLVIGTDSGFEGSTALFYTQVEVSFNQL